MQIAAQVLVVLVALFHVWFMVLECFLWTTPFAAKRLKRKPEELEATKVMAQNQGVYNLFLAAGLAWSFFAAADTAFSLRLFFLGCVIVAGVVGAATASKQILFLQALPATLALALVLLAHSS